MWGSLGGGAVCQYGSMEGMHVSMFFFLQSSGLSLIQIQVWSRDPSLRQTVTTKLSLYHIQDISMCIARYKHGGPRMNKQTGNL